MLGRQLASYRIYLLPLALTACGNNHAPDPRTEAPLVRSWPFKAHSPHLDHSLVSWRPGFKATLAFVYQGRC